MYKRVSPCHSGALNNKPLKLNVINPIQLFNTKNKPVAIKLEISTWGSIEILQILKQSEKTEFPLSTCHQLNYLQPEGAFTGLIGRLDLFIHLH